MTTGTSITIPAEVFRGALLSVLDEATDSVHGMFLDKGDSLFETLVGITADQASQPLGPGSGTIAAKVNHLRVYFDAVLTNVRAGEFVPVDWDASWAVGSVDEATWQALVARLRASVNEFRALAAGNDSWPDVVLGGALAVVAHTAYHLGEIRQALATIRANPAPA